MNMCQKCSCILKGGEKPIKKRSTNNQYNPFLWSLREKKLKLWTFVLTLLVWWHLFCDVKKKKKKWDFHPHLGFKQLELFSESVFSTVVLNKHYSVCLECEQWFASAPVPVCHVLFQAHRLLLEWICNLCLLTYSMDCFSCRLSQYNVNKMSINEIRNRKKAAMW